MRKAKLYLDVTLLVAQIIYMTWEPNHLTLWKRLRVRMDRE